MKKYARVENSVVVELMDTDGDIKSMFHPALDWRDVSAAVGIVEGCVITPQGYIQPIKRVVTLDETSSAAKAALLQIDLDSIGAIRDYILSKADAPQLLKDKEAAATIERVKIK